VRTATDLVLEPSAGDGNFVVAIAQRLRELDCSISDIYRQVKSVEIDAEEARRANRRLASALGGADVKTTVCSDFFEWLERYPGQQFDAVVGNPPFIRYQNFPEPSRSTAMAMLVRLGFRPNRLTNIWVPFVVGATAALAENGRMALVLPAELLQVSYAAQLRSFLVDSFRSIEVVACNEMLFEKAEQEVVVLLAEGKATHPSAENECSIDFREAENFEELMALGTTSSKTRTAAKLVRHDSEKWLKYFLSSREITLMRRLRETEEVTVLARHGSVDVGVVTGENGFFVVTREQAEEHGLDPHCRRLAARSAHLRGAIFTPEEWESLANDGQRVHLFTVDRKSNVPVLPATAQYIRAGERQSCHKGYKCSIREPWYSVPAVWAPDCFLFRQIYDFPRVVLNRAAAVSTDTIHRLSCKSDPLRLAENTYTHLTAASAEIEGRSYGGGVLELEPTEAERLLLPRRLVASAMPLAEADRLIRDGKLCDVLAENDRSVLKNGLGLAQDECRMLKEIWEKMRNRRASRKRIRRSAR
jgi:adenine-specific DNA methylase